MVARKKGGYRVRPSRPCFRRESGIFWNPSEREDFLTGTLDNPDMVQIDAKILV